MTGLAGRFARSFILVSFSISHSSSAAEVAVPRVLDPNLEISLLAAEPAIVTPIGIAADSKGRIFVIESHTHEVKPDYPGPSHDRIKIFREIHDEVLPTRAESSVFAEGLRHTMNLAFSPTGELYATHRSGIIILHDRNDDGVSEHRTSIVRLETSETFAHNGIGGLAISPDGWLYFGLGENLGRPYTVHGSDGSKHSGGSEGGNVFRCRLDGSKIERFATGFWNPFGLEFDRNGNFFCIDNDPDGRPPCRLLRVIDNGDYGYKFRFGRSGLHPFVSWEGELPGTLPMVSGTGEAPSGILDGAKAKLPAQYRTHLIVTSWGDNAIETYPLERWGASFRSQKQIVVQGDLSFRPVGIASGASGAVYITDWADQAYPVHQKGRLWKLSLKAPYRGQFSNQAPNRHDSASRSNQQKLQHLLHASALADYSELRSTLESADPFLRSAAMSSLSKPVFRSNLVRDLQNKTASIRLGALLALRRGQHAIPEAILKSLLSDPDEPIRLMALVWIGEQELTSLEPDLDLVLGAGPLSARVFKVYLAAAEILAASSADPRPDRSVWDQGSTGIALIQQVLADPAKPSAVRALALTMISVFDEPRTFGPVLQLASDPDIHLQTEAIRTLAQSSSSRASAELEQIAFDRSRAANPRAEAMLGLATQRPGAASTFVSLLDDPASEVRLEAARLLRLFSASSEVRRKFNQTLRTLPPKSEKYSALSEQLLLALNQKGTIQLNQRPETDEEWSQVLLTQDARTFKAEDLSSGRRVFFNPAIGCAKCHRVGGRGEEVGPDLSTIGQSSDRAKLLDAILNPSQNIAPQFVRYDVETADDQNISGLLAGREPDNSITLLLADGTKRTIAGNHVSKVSESNVSLMPDGLEAGLTVHDFQDLLAFLESLK